MAYPTDRQASHRRARLHRRSAASRFGGRAGLIFLSVLAVLALSAATVLGLVNDSGSFSIEGTDDESFVEITTNEGAIVQFIGEDSPQGDLGASGSGVYDSFVRLQATGSEQGFNTDAAINPGDTLNTSGGEFTHSMLVSQIPVVEVEGASYWEVFADLNENNSESGRPISLNDFEIWYTDDPSIIDYPFDDPTADGELVYDFEGEILILDWNSGSGRGDVRYLIPLDQIAIPAGCDYGNAGCDVYFVLYSQWGTTEGYESDATFEEWKVKLYPIVTVDKTVEASVTRTYPWTIAKEADGEPDHINIFAGDTAEIDWTVTATVGTPTDSDATISGTITIHNPTGSDPFDPVAAEIESIEDLLTQGAVETSFVVECPDVDAFPFVLGPGGTLECTYSGTSTSDDDGTNTATVTLNVLDSQGDPVDTIQFDGSADLDFADATVELIDECIVVTDDHPVPDTVLDSELCFDESPGVYPFSTTVGPYDVAECDTDSITNTAAFETVDDENDTTQNGSASDTVTVTCYELTVTKDAIQELVRTYPWTIAKEADGEPDHIDIFAGDTATINWTVTATVGAPTDSGWAVHGTITITNPAPMLADDVDVSDVISHASLADVNATIDCGGGAGDTVVDVPASGQATCSYTATLGNGDDRTNTATAELFGEEYSGTAAVDFDGATAALVDECIVVTDDHPVPGTILDSELCFDESPGSYPLSTDVGPYTVEDCDTDSITNTAAFVAVDDANDTGATGSASDTVTVTCYELTVNKDADETFDRDYDWDITKTRVIVEGEIDGDLDPATLTLDENQAYTLHYEVEVSVSGFTDDNHAVAGTITINNPAPMLADDVVVSDVISHAVDPDILPTLDCGDGPGDDEVDVPATGSATCDYSADLPNADDRTNTATATLFEIDYTGTASIDFAGADMTEIDECVDVTDNNGTADTSDDVDLGTVCAADAPETFEFSIDIDGFAVCGQYEFTNVATYLAVNDENDTGETDSATYTVIIDVPCPQGCTLTWGYWKTHNESFRGGAPADPTWLLILPSAEDSPFFLSGQTYFEVLWTAPQGNVYYNLAHQYIAAILNQLDGAAVPPAVQTAINQATTLFNTYTDEQVAVWKGKVGKAQRAEFIALAGILASYNEGAIGPGHCDEPAVPSLAFSLAPSARLR
jgi:hypothetical protein